MLPHRVAVIFREAVRQWGWVGDASRRQALGLGESEGCGLPLLLRNGRPSGNLGRATGLILLDYRGHLETHRPHLDGINRASFTGFLSGLDVGYVLCHDLDIYIHTCIISKGFIWIYL